MNICIGEKLVVTSDQHQFILNEKKLVKAGAKAGSEVLVPIGYYPKLSQLINGLIHQGVREADINSLKEMNAEIGRISQLCCESFGVASHD